MSRMDSWPAPDALSPSSDSPVTIQEMVQILCAFRDVAADAPARAGVATAQSSTEDLSFWSRVAAYCASRVSSRPARTDEIYASTVEELVQKSFDRHKYIGQGCWRRVFGFIDQFNLANLWLQKPWTWALPEISSPPVLSESQPAEACSMCQSCQSKRLANVSTINAARLHVSNALLTQCYLTSASSAVRSAAMQQLEKDLEGADVVLALAQKNAHHLNFECAALSMGE